MWEEINELVCIYEQLMDKYQVVEGLGWGVAMDWQRFIDLGELLLRESAKDIHCGIPAVWQWSIHNVISKLMSWQGAKRANEFTKGCRGQHWLCHWCERTKRVLGLICGVFIPGNMMCDIRE